MKKTLKIITVLSCLLLFVGCKTKDIISYKMYGYTYQKIGVTTLFYPSVSLATFNPSELEDYRIISYILLYEDNKNQKKIEFESKDFLLFEKILFKEKKNFGTFWITTFSLRESLGTKVPNFKKINSIIVKLDYKINGTWYSTEIEKFDPNIITDEFWE